MIIMIIIIIMQASLNRSRHCLPGDEPSQPVAGVIGAAFSGVSIMVANILKLFKVRWNCAKTRKSIFRLGLS